MSIEIHTFGCKVNTYDSGLLQNKLDLTSGGTQKVHILNTCAVTAEATKEAVRHIKKIKEKDPQSKIVVTGCSAQVDSGFFTDLNQVDLIIANSHKGQIGDLVNRLVNSESNGTPLEKLYRSNIFKKEDLEVGGGQEQSRTRSFLKIQDGCNAFCSYCIIPYARGKSRSISAKEIVQRVNELHLSGTQEVIITGIHIADYHDEKENLFLDDLVSMLLKETKMPRFRISSLEPAELTESLLDLYSDERMCGHFHLSIQSAHTQVLKDMKRKYNQKQVQDVFERISKKRPDAYIGMDLIVGYPTESKDAFAETVQVLKDSFWTKIHVFPYSERPGTKATTHTETVPWEERTQRSALIRELSEERTSSESQKQIGQVMEVLLLKKGNSSQSVQGLSRNNWIVDLDLNEDRLAIWESGLHQVKVESVLKPRLRFRDPHLKAELL